MKILLFNSFYHPYTVGGAEISVRLLAESLVAMGHKVSVVSLHSKKGIQTSKLNGVCVYYVALKNIYWPYKNHLKGLRPFWHLIDIRNPLMEKLAGQIIRKEKPDVVHTNNLSGFSVAPWFASHKLRVPILHTMRDHYLMCFRSTMFKDNGICKSQCLECRIFAYYKKKATSLVDSAVGISPYILDKHVELGFFRHTPIKSIIPNGYKTCLKSVRRNPPTVRFGYIGRLDPSKGIEKALDSFRQINPETCDFFIAGKGRRSYEKMLYSTYNRPNIYFLGFTEPDQFFKKIDILIVPSLWNEPFGRTIIEAFAHGIPVIGSNNGAIPDLIDIGKTGFIFSITNSPTLLDILAKIIQCPEIINDMSAHAIKAAKKFLPEKITSHYLQKYKQLL